MSSPTPSLSSPSLFLRRPWVRALGALTLILAIGAIFHADGAFFSPDTHRDMFRYIARCGILACGLTPVIIAAGIDLSVGSLLGLSAVSFSILTIHWGWSPAVAVPACLALGAGCGLVSGGVIAGFGVQPFVATLAMMVFARGMAKWISGGQKISTSVPLATPDADGSSFQFVEPPPIFEWLSGRILGGNVAIVTLIFLCCTIACWLLLSRTRWGRHLYAIGGNEEAARLSGIRVGAMKMSAYALSGFLCAVAGICQAAEELQGDPEAGQSYELTAIAIVVIGGTSLMGGRGGAGLTLLGAMTIGYLEKILSINAVGEATRLMLTGAIIVGAVLFQRSRR